MVGIVNDSFIREESLSTFPSDLSDSLASLRIAVCEGASGSDGSGDLFMTSVSLSECVSFLEDSVDSLSS